MSVSASADSPDSLLARLLPYLTKGIHYTSPFITTFLLIHLSAPVMVNVGGSGLASEMMLLGREYYQTSFGEKFLVLGPIAVHALSAIAKRLLSPRPLSQPRPWKTALTITGYSTFLFLLPIHFLTHRALPAAGHDALGPSELDYEFIKYGLQRFPLQSWALYASLVAGVMVHAVDGVGIIWNTYLTERFGRLKRETRNARVGAVLGGVVLPVLTGLAFVAREPLMVFSHMAKRFEGVFTQVWVYRI